MKKLPFSLHRVKSHRVIESKIPVTIFATNNKRNKKIEIYQKCCNLIKIELVLTRDFYATTKLNPEHVEIGVTNAILIGSGMFMESLVRLMDQDYPRSPFTVLDTLLQNEELESTIALLFSMQKPKSFEILRKSFLWNSHCVEPLLNDKNMTLHEMRVTLTGTKKKTKKCLAKPKLLRRIPAKNALQQDPHPPKALIEETVPLDHQ